MRISVGLTALTLAAFLAASPISAATVNLGANGGGLLGGGTSTSGSGTSVNANVNTGTGTGTGTTNGVLDLFGNGQTPTTATVDLGTSGGADSGNLLNLFGSGTGVDSANANLAVGNGDGTDANVLVDLFGNGGNSQNAQVTAGLGGLGSGTGAGATVGLDLFGDGTTPIGTDPGTSGGGSGGSGGTIGGGTSVASLDTRAGSGCFTPNPTQLAKLAARHTYNAATFNGWMGVSTIKVIRAGLCPTSVRDVAAQSNIAQLQSFFSGNQGLRDRLAKWGHQPNDVIAVDRQGTTLIVYVS